MKTRKSFELELLRKGLAYPQLLSPVTDYQALCGNHEAQTVHLPFEHHEFLQRMKALSYRDGGSEHRAEQIRRTAVDLEKVLGQIPGLIAELASCDTSEEGVIHLRLVLSAPELALLPFELALGPRGFPAAGQEVALQPEAPISITREVRRVSGQTLRWPDEPNILFAAASPPGSGSIPLRAHLLALRHALGPWVDSPTRRIREERIRNLLTVLPNASLHTIQKECMRNAYTHIHILCHGEPLEEPNKGKFGLALYDRRGSGKEIVDGKRLAGALRGHREDPNEFLSSPVVVSVASCDGGNIGDIITPGASVAHALHQGGIAFVVASQFPLTKQGSVVMTQILYKRLLWGDDPRVILHDVRQRLFQLNPHSHDWGSLVAYASLPSDFERQLVSVQSAQATRAMGTAMGRVESPVVKVKEETPIEFDKRFRSAIEDGLRALDLAMGRMPVDEEEEEGFVVPMVSSSVEKLGIRGSVEKRRAWVYHQLSHNRGDLIDRFEKEGHDDPARIDRLKDEKRTYERESWETLRKAMDHYRRAFEIDMSTYWAGVQFLCLLVVTTKSQDEDRDVLKKEHKKYWTIAEAAAELDAESQDRMLCAWAYGSLMELALLTLEVGSTAERKRASKRVDNMWEKFRKVAPEGSPERVSTVRQMRRYVNWWTHLTVAHEKAESLWGDGRR